MADLLFYMYLAKCVCVSVHVCVVSVCVCTRVCGREKWREGGKERRCAGAGSTKEWKKYDTESKTISSHIIWESNTCTSIT